VARAAVADRWDTVPVGGHVLAVARTLTSATRVLDVLAVLRPEDGVRVSFTVNPGSAFAAGLDAFVRSLPGVTALSWEEALRREFDVAVACAVHPSMGRLRPPLVVLPHGAGYNRLVRRSTGDGWSAAGLSRRELTYRGRVYPAVVGLSHAEQLTRLRRSCPAAVERARVVGDPCFDRVLESLSRRDRYRAALGGRPGRRVVVVNSTWSEHSLLGRVPDLPLRLLHALPADEFAVVLVLHPNIWARHDPLALLRQAEEAGLVVVPPQAGWQAALVAADWVVGDHGSVSFYGAALDRVTLLAATGEHELDPDSPAFAFGRSAPALDPDGDLHAQLTGAAERHEAAALREVTDRTLGGRGESARAVRELLYSYLPRLATPPPDEPGPAPYPDPVPLRVGEPTAYDVLAEAVRPGEVRVRRYPLDARPGATPRGFYAVTDEERRLRLRGVAEVVARTVPYADPAPVEWLTATAAALPGLGVAVAALDGERHLVRLTSGALLEAHALRPWGAPTPRLDPVVLGAALAVRPTESSGRLTIRTGEQTLEVALTPGPRA
jgi:hypothetical protein